MKTTIDSAGRVVIPRAARVAAQLEPGTDPSECADRIGSAGRHEERPAGPGLEPCPEHCERHQLHPSSPEDVRTQRVIHPQDVADVRRQRLWEQDQRDVEAERATVDGGGQCMV